MSELRKCPTCGLPFGGRAPCLCQRSKSSDGVFDAVLILGVLVGICAGLVSLAWWAWGEVAKNGLEGVGNVFVQFTYGTVIFAAVILGVAVALHSFIWSVVGMISWIYLVNKEKSLSRGSSLLFQHAANTIRSYFNIDPKPIVRKWNKPPPIVPGPHAISLARYGDIENGMTLQDVATKLGFQPQERISGYRDFRVTLATYRWTDKDGHNVVASFQNGQLDHVHQIGLS